MKETKTEILAQLKKLSLEEVATVIQTLEKKCANATLLAQHEALPEGDHYALFVWQPKPLPMRSLMDILYSQEREEYKEPKEQEKMLVFVKMSKDVKELSEIIRREPGHNYVIMRGGLMNVKSMTQIFVDGKNFNTLESEWS